jgi:hypothetical protein
MRPLFKTAEEIRFFQSQALNELDLTDTNIE